MYSNEYAVKIDHSKANIVPKVGFHAWLRLQKEDMNRSH